MSLLERALDALPARVRFVSPEPPHAPEPHPDEPFAPVYDYEPLSPYSYDVDAVVTRDPDTVLDRSRHCEPCDVTWAQAGGAACWNCGRTG